MPSALLLPVVTCAVVLVVSGAGKLRSPDSVDAGFTSLDVPGWLDTVVVRRLVPWVELALGLWLLLATGPALVLVAVLVLLLFVAYLVLVVRAVRRPEPVDCGCFGALGDSRVTRVTVWRNAVLVLSAALCVVAGLRGVGLIGAVVDGSALPWVASAALSAAVAALVVHRAPVPDVAPGRPLGAEPETDDSDSGYRRRITPRAEVLTEDGRLVLVSEQTATTAHLLVFLSPGCGPCGRIGPQLARWGADLDPVAVRAVVSAQPRSIAEMPYLAGHAWFDPFALARTAFGVGTPSAVLLGTDGLLAGGPVQGEDDVTAFVAELTGRLREGDPVSDVR
jgi:hypothetical protein